MEKLRTVGGEIVPGEHESWDELAEHSLTHDNLPDTKPDH